MSASVTATELSRVAPRARLTSKRAAALGAAVIATLVLALPAPARAQRPTQGEDESAQLVDTGREALRKGDYDGAARALDQALALNPRRLEAYALRAAVHAARGEHDRGVALMRRARELAPNDDDVLAALGIQLVLGGSTGEGVALLEDVVTRGPGRYEAHALLGHHYADLARWGDATRALEAYFRSRPAELSGEDDRHRLDLAESYLRTRRPAEARDLYRGVVSRHPEWLTARMGLAWSLAAIDCRKAMPALTALGQMASAPPEVKLVRGQCALAMGDAGTALRLARAYLEQEAASGAGHALLGEAEAARGNLAAARAALEQARTLEPQRRRYAVRLARVLRLGQDAGAAVTVLDSIGPPADPGGDPGYWIELGDGLLDAGRAAEVRDRLAPALAALPGDAELRTVIGDARLRTGDAAGAVVDLDAAMVAPSQRTRRLLSAALLAVAVAAIDRDDLGAATTALVRADKVEGSPAVWRNLGLVHLLRGDGGAAVAPLERAAVAAPDAATLLLLGRAHAARGAAAAAHDVFARALTAARGGPLAVEAAIEVASFELGAGRAGDAVDVLQGAAADARAAKGETLARWSAAASTARHAAGLAALQSGQASRAVGLLNDALDGAGPDDTTAIKCDLAVATVAAGDRDRALTRLKAISKLSCPFPAPADTQAVPVLIAFTEGLQPRRAARALGKLRALERQTTGVTRQLLTTATRVVALTAADEAYRSGKLRPARKHLATARAAQTRAGADEMALDLAALDVADGRLAAARAALERLAPKLPEALIHLGVIEDRQGDGVRALDYWRRAKQAGVRFGPLDEWIAAKERIWGGGK